MKDKIVKLLLVLVEKGNTAEAVAEKLVSLGINGRRQTCRNCPIANYLRSCEPKLFKYVEITSYCVEVLGQQFYYMEDVGSDIIDRIFGIRNFIDAFDGGRFSECAA